MSNHSEPPVHSHSNRFTRWESTIAPLELGPWNPAENWNYLTEKIEAVRQYTATNARNAIQQIQEIVEDKKKQIEESIKILENGGAAIARKYLYELDDYVQPARKAIAEAEKKGIDVTECAKKQQALERLVDQVMDAVNACARKQVTNTKKDVNRIYECSEEAIRGLSEDLVKLYNCDSMACAAKVSASAGLKATKSVMLVTSRTGSIYSSVQNRILNLPVKCGDDVLANFRTDLRKAAKDVEDCVAKSTLKHSSKL